MSLTQLSCNLTSCRKKLNYKAYVTSCSHIFCTEHMENINEGRNRACLACSTSLRSELDFVLIDLNPTEQYKSVVLSGLNPDQIMEIASRAINFFVYQLSYENQYKEASLRRSTQTCEELQHYCTSLTAKFKSDLFKQKRVVETFKHDLDDKQKEIEMQTQQLVQSKRMISKLQTQVESYKRELVNRHLHPNESPCTRRSHSHSSKGSKFHPQIPEPIPSQRFYPAFDGQNNEGVNNSAQFLSPFVHLRFPR